MEKTENFIARATKSLQRMLSARLEIRELYHDFRRDFERRVYKLTSAESSRICDFLM